MISFITSKNDTDIIVQYRSDSRKVVSLGQNLIQKYYTKIFPKFTAAEITTQADAVMA